MEIDTETIINMVAYNIGVAARQQKEKYGLSAQMLDHALALARLQNKDDAAAENLALILQQADEIAKLQEQQKEAEKEQSKEGEKNEPAKKPKN